MPLSELANWITEMDTFGQFNQVTLSGSDATDCEFGSISSLVSFSVLD